MLSFHRGFCLILAEKKSVQYNNNLDKDIWIAKAKPNPFKFKKGRLLRFLCLWEINKQVNPLSIKHEIA